MNTERFKRLKDALARRWPKRLGRLRTSTVVLSIVFVVLVWVQQAYRPAPPPPPVPPGFIPSPEYTWVPRTAVRTTQAPRTTTATTTPTTTTTPTPTTTASETPSDESPTSTAPSGEMPTNAPRTTVIDPDGPGILPPITLPVLPGQPPPPAEPQPQPGQEPVAPTLPR